MEPVSDEIDDLRVVYSGEELLETACLVAANLVIVEMALDGLVALDCVDRIRAVNEDCHFIGIADEADCDALRTAFNLKMDEFLTMPVGAGTLFAAMGRMVDQISQRQEQRIDAQYQYAVRQLFASKLYMTQTSNADLDTVNNLMCTTFRPGYYQVILLCGDFPGTRIAYQKLLPPMQRRWLHCIRGLIGDYCNDILYDNSKEGLALFLNYSTDMRQIVWSRFEDILTQCREMAEPDVRVSLCIGRFYENLQGLAESRQDTRVTKWNRLSQGIERVLYSNLVEYLPEYADTLDELFEELQKAIDLANYSRFDKLTTQLFRLPKKALGRYRVRVKIAELVSHFIDVNYKVLGEYFLVDKLAHQIDDDMDAQWTFELFEACFRRWFQLLFEKVEVGAGSQNDVLIRKAKQYVRDNYSGHISVDVVADWVNLSPVYFSHLFKVKMGQNFTEYVCCYRIDRSKELLKETDMNINEVAETTGFSDTRYFSRKFKELTGMTPSQFRKLYNV